MKLPGRSIISAILAVIIWGLLTLKKPSSSDAKMQLYVFGITFKFTQTSEFYCLPSFSSCIGTRFGLRQILQNPLPCDVTKSKMPRAINESRMTLPLSISKGSRLILIRVSHLEIPRMVFSVRLRDISTMKSQSSITLQRDTYNLRLQIKQATHKTECATLCLNPPFRPSFRLQLIGDSDGVMKKR